jgi:hypothetical protein
MIGKYFALVIEEEKDDVAKKGTATMSSLLLARPPRINTAWIYLRFSKIPGNP